MHIAMFILAAFGAAVSVWGVEPMVWPTPHPGPAMGAGFEEWIQPTVSGDPLSGTFGCVRNGGTRFHEALDIAPFEPRRRGEPTDAVGAAWSGTVVYVNTSVRDSAYGRYIVVEHGGFSPAYITLYAHLAKVARGIRAGVSVRAGDRLGTMGRSAGGYRIPPERAHLHFEIGLRLSDQFQRWYDAQDFPTKNEHGVWNGMNLIGMDPLAAWKWLQVDPSRRSIPGFIETLPTAFILDIATSEVPDFARRYPSLVEGRMPAGGIGGWRVAVTGWGLPLKLTPLALGSVKTRPGTVTIVAVDPKQIEAWPCRELVSYRNGLATLQVRGRRLLQLLFTFDLGN